MRRPETPNEAGEPPSARHSHLWRGPALVDFAHEPFAQAEIARLEELRLTAIEARIDADLVCGRHAALVPELEALVDRAARTERASAGS